MLTAEHGLLMSGVLEWTLQSGLHSRPGLQSLVSPSGSNFLLHINSSTSNLKYVPESEFRVLTNIPEIQQLSTFKKQLTHESAEQEHLIARFRNMVGEDSYEQPDPDLNNLAVDVMRKAAPLSFQMFLSRAPPGPKRTPFYLLARSAPRLDLHFVVQGMQGETLEVPVRMLDMAFVLDQTLKRKGWKEETAWGCVMGWMEVPMIEVGWRGREEEVGILEKRI